MRVAWTPDGWAQYTSHTDRALVRRINALIGDIGRNGHEGIGKPEPLRGEWAGWWSRRINEEHRLVYRLDGDDIVIAACRYHYGK